MGQIVQLKKSIAKIEDRRSVSRGWEKGLFGELLFSYDLAAPAGLLAGLRRIASGDLFVPCGMARCFPSLRPASFDYFHVECCEASKTYIKSVDLTKKGRADPMVDELSSAPLDLWAREHGLHQAAK